jgi:2-dehydropantoate 2-reductase
MKRIAVIGVGAIGGVAASALADLKRHSIVLCTRSSFDQLVVKHPDGISRVAAEVVCDPAELDSDSDPMDWILLSTKAHHSEAASAWFERLSGANTKVAVLQNGVDHIERITPLVASGTPVLPVVVRLPAEKISPGCVEQSRAGQLVVPDDDLGRAFASLFDGGGRVEVLPVADFATQAWWKLTFNAALGGICALTIRDNSIAEDPELRDLLLALMREVVEVARAEGAKLPGDAPEKLLSRISSGATGHWSSITVDRRENRPMEWRVRNEVVGRLARRHGIETPINDTITALLRVADASYSESD